MSLTAQEREVLDHLAVAWNLWCEIDGRFLHDDREFNAAIHHAQQLIALRVARRADPDVWHTPAAIPED